MIDLAKLKDLWIELTEAQIRMSKVPNCNQVTLTVCLDEEKSENLIKNMDSIFSPVEFRVGTIRLYHKNCRNRDRTDATFFGLVLSLQTIGTV